MVERGNILVSGEKYDLQPTVLGDNRIGMKGTITASSVKKNQWARSRPSFESENEAWNDCSRSRRMNIEWDLFFLYFQRFSTIDYIRNGGPIHI